MFPPINATPSSHGAVFLDRDGTLNEEVGYPDSLEKIKLIPGAIEAVKIFNQLALKVIVVTNQSGVARGFFDEERVVEIHRGMQQIFKDQGATIDSFYYCPHHPDFGTPEYKIRCQCRKPEPGLFFRAAQEHGIGFEKSFAIGDKLADIETGQRLNMKTILVLTGYGREQLRKSREEPGKPQVEFVAQDIREAAEWVKHYLERD